MTIYVLTFKATAQHDADKRAGLNRFLKTMLRTYGLRCTNIEEKEQVVERANLTSVKDLNSLSPRKRSTRRLDNDTLPETRSTSETRGAPRIT
jgi:hypothetical protein